MNLIWRRVLKNPSVGLDDNFFLAGGDSLLAVELFLQIERELKQRLPVAILFEAGTVAEMAKLIEDGTPQGCIVPIQTVGTKPPFFCVHGATGQVIGFHHLSRHLGEDQPFYGIQAIGWDATTPPYTKTRDMAAHYVTAMREVQPHGPYYLGGYSFGGRIAVYMANILKEAGEEVAFLALLDPSCLAGRTYVSFGQWLERIKAPRGPSRILLACRYSWFRLRRAIDGVYARVRRAVLFPIREYYRFSGRKIPMSMRRPDRLNTDEHPVIEFLAPVAHLERSRLSPRRLGRFYDEVLAEMPARNLVYDPLPGSPAWDPTGGRRRQREWLADRNRP